MLTDIRVGMNADLRPTANRRSGFNPTSVSV
jgi:hypothetical protein